MKVAKDKNRKVKDEKEAKKAEAAGWKSQMMSGGIQEETGF